MVHTIPQNSISQNSKNVHSKKYKYHCRKGSLFETRFFLPIYVRYCIIMVNKADINVAKGETMAEYKEMYFKLFNDITDTIEKLQQMQKDAEELFISQESHETEEA